MIETLSILMHVFNKNRLKFRFENQTVVLNTKASIKPLDECSSNNKPINVKFQHFKRFQKNF